jgi:CubicO group peptidase (beta-lactamase class C family)
MITRPAPPAAACFALLFCASGSAAETPAAPDEAGISSARLDRFDRVIQSYVDRRMLAGAVTLVAKDGRVVHRKASGYQDVETARPMTRSSACSR